MSRKSEALEGVTIAGVEYYLWTNQTGIKSSVNSFPYKKAVLALMKMIGLSTVPYAMSLY